MLDIKTVFLFSAVINLCTVAAVTLGWFRSDRRGDIRQWILASWLMAAGSTVMLVSDSEAYSLAGYLGGFAYMASMGCLLLGFKSFFGMTYKPHEALSVAVVVSTGIFLSRYFTQGVFDGVWLLYLGSGANLVLITLVIWQGSRSEALPSRRLAVAVTAIYALVNLAVAPFAYWTPLGFVDGLPQAQWLSICSIPLVVCNVATYLVVLVLKLERSTERQRVLATRDMLTGVLNRRAFYHGVSRLGTHSGAMGVIDLDHFKSINDAHGHKGGDDALRAFARATQSVLPPSAIFGRTGGEEFAICLPGADAVAAAEIFEVVREEVAALEVPSPKGGLIGITISCGYSMFNAERWAMDQTIAEADNALYQAKHNGRNRVELYAPANWLQRCIESTLATLSASNKA